MPKPAFSDTDTMPMLATNQLANAMDLAINADTVNRLPWVLSALGFSGTPEEQLTLAINTIRVMAGHSRSRLVVDMDVDLTETLLVNADNLQIEARDTRSTKITLSGATRNYGIQSTSENFSLIGFVVEANSVPVIGIVRVQGVDSEVLNCEIYSDDAATVYADRAANNGGVGNGYDSLSGISILSTAENTKIKCNYIHDVHTCVNASRCADGLRVINNKFENYIGRAVFATGKDAIGTDDVRIIDNDFLVPAECYITDPVTGVSTNAIRQPVAIQQGSGGSRIRNFRAHDNTVIGNGDPFVSDNVVDSAGSNSDVLSRGMADALSFHALDGFSIKNNHVSDGGELGIAVSINSRNGSVQNNTLIRCDTGAIFVGSALAVNSSANVDMSNNTAIDCSLDRNGDHSAQCSFQFIRAIGCTASGNSSISTVMPENDWSPTTSYIVGQKVTIRATSDGRWNLPAIDSYAGLSSWIPSPADDFVPGYFFRHNGINAGTGQQVYRVPAGFVGSKGAVWDATEEARYSHMGNLADLGNKSSFVTYECITPNTNNFPGWGSGEWVISHEQSAANLLVEDSTMISVRNNSGIGQVLDDHVVFDDVSTFVEIEAITVATDYYPIITGNSNISSLYDSDIDEFVRYRNGAWRVEAEAMLWQAYTNTNGAQFQDHGNVASVTQDPDNDGTINLYRFALSVPLPSTTWPVSVTNHSAPGRSFRLSIPDVNTIEIMSFNQSGATPLTADFSISAISQ